MLRTSISKHIHVQTRILVLDAGSFLSICCDSPDIAASLMQVAGSAQLAVATACHVHNIYCCTYGLHGGLRRAISRLPAEGLRICDS